MPASGDGPALGAGDRYDSFSIERLIGSGTFAWVYAARSADYPDQIALKLSREPVTSEATALRALREIRILSSLNNPHVVQVYDHGLGPDERWFLVMELLEGGELAAVHDFDKPLAAAEATRSIYQSCLGLEPAHARGVVHRDLKPGNLWVCKDGSIKVLDFGLARSWDEDSIVGANATHGHMLVGTPHYAQPEQAKSGILTPASDVYSLGILLYELVTGHMPLFPDDPVSVVRERLEQSPIDWLAAHLELPVVPIERYPQGRALAPEVRDAIHACLEKDPERRPATAGELAGMLIWGVAVEDGGYAGATGVVLQDVGGDGGRARRFMLGEGEHRIGAGQCCEVELESDAVGWVFATVRCSPELGPPELIPVRTDGFIRVDGHPVRQSVRLEVGSTVELGPHRLQVLAR